MQKKYSLRGRMNRDSYISQIKYTRLKNYIKINKYLLIIALNALKEYKLN